MTRLAPPGGTSPPQSAHLGDRSVALEPLAREISRRYRAEYPDERDRYGPAGEAWCLHDNKYLLAWAIEDATEGRHFAANVTWLAGVLAARQFPLERLARDLEIAADVVAESLEGDTRGVEARLRNGAELALGWRETPEAPAPRQAQLRTAYVTALLSGEATAARRMVEKAVDGGLGVRDAYLEILQPALYQIGDLWAAGGASVAQEHLATATTEALAAQLAARLPRSADSGRRIVVSGTEGELHAVGTRFVADFLEAEGWSVLALGASTPTRDLVSFVERERPDVVALSTTLTTNLPAAEAALTQVRALPDRPLLAVGGAAYRGDEELARRCGADLFAVDAAALVDALRDRFQA